MTADQIVVQQALAGDESAFKELWTRHSPHIDAVVRRLCGSLDMVEDLAQDAWMQIFRALPSYRGDSAFGTWAHRIAVNRTLNSLRRLKRVGNEVELDEAEGVVADDGYSNFHDKQLMQSIDDAVKVLSPGARTVFVLHDVEGYTHEEIASIVGITVGGSKSQLFKARLRLRKLLGHLKQDNDFLGIEDAHVTSL